MASILKRGPSWRALARRGDGSRVAKTFKLKSDAQAWAAEVEAEARRQKARRSEQPVVVVSGLSVKDLLERYAEEVSPTKKSCKRETDFIRAIIRDFPALADTPLFKLEPAGLAAWRDARLRKVSAASVIREMTVFGHALEVARREWGWLKENPMRDVRRPSGGNVARERRPTAEEIEQIVSASGFDDALPPETQTARVGAAYLFAIETAMRAGEICRLEWKDIDFAKGTARIIESKNGHPRTVPLSVRAEEILSLLKKVEAEQPASAPGEVFKLAPALVDALYRKIRTRAGVDKDLRFHDTRREALSRLASQGMPIHKLAKISGHRDLRILQNVYYEQDVAELTAEVRAMESARAAAH